LFNKTLRYKDYDCSKTLSAYDSRPPLFNLYLQVTDVCNAKCSFCDKANCISSDVELDKDKLMNILKELTERNMLGKISLTGGEPLLRVERLNEILEIIHLVNPLAYVSLNTNGSRLENFREIKRPEFIKEVDMSRHHYNELENNAVFGIRVANFKEIHDFLSQNEHIILKLNCVMTKNQISTIHDVERYLEELATYGIKEVRFISLLNLTEGYEDLFLDVKPLIEQFKKHTNIGSLYDKDICECFGFMYVASNGFPVTAFVRNTKKATCDYLRQLVYTPDNSLLDGFNGQIII